MWNLWTLSFGMSKNFGEKKGKLKSVGFCEASSTCSENAPERSAKNYRINRIRKRNNYFIYKGKIF